MRYKIISKWSDEPEPDVMTFDNQREFNEYWAALMLMVDICFDRPRGSLTCSVSMEISNE